MLDAPFAVRIGLGWDAHPLVPGRPLLLGGVRIRHARGLGGHSDGDVLCHAVADALLGATGLGDLGARFPAGRPETRGLAGLRILRDVGRLAREFALLNIDAAVLCERPRLGRHVAAMRRNIARALCVGDDRVRVKVKSPEGLGALGRGEGIAAQAVCLVVGFT